MAAKPFNGKGAGVTDVSPTIRGGRLVYTIRQNGHSLLIGIAITTAILFWAIGQFVRPDEKLLRVQKQQEVKATWCRKHWGGVTAGWESPGTQGCSPEHAKAIDEGYRNGISTPPMPWKGQ